MIENRIKETQTILNGFSIDCGKPDGIIGEKTLRGIKEFQSVFGLRVDGIVGVISYKVLMKLKDVRSFKVNEFQCRHCKKVKLDVDMLVLLQKLRDRVGALRITSGYRCTTHNKNVGGAKNSQHLKGTACDVVPLESNVRNVYSHANEVFMRGGVGSYKTFTHVDNRGYRSRW